MVYVMFFQFVGAEKVLCDHHMREIRRIERIRTYLDVEGLQSTYIHS